jgi:hypothetical protein
MRVIRDVRAPPSVSIAGSTAAEVQERVIGIAPSPLLPGEAEADYVGVAERIITVAQPKDAIEEFLTRDVIDLTWEILRLRRLKAGLLRASSGGGIFKVMHSLGYNERKGYGAATALGARWASGEKSARDEVAAVLKKAQLSIDDVMAETLESKIDTFERIDRMLASAEARRNNALREIDRHREALGAAMRRGVDEVEDAEFRDVETDEVSGGPRS